MTDTSDDNMRALNDVSPEMRKRLASMIARKDPHFILTGTDPAEKGGCCPSNEVGHANSLASSGILQSWQASGTKDTCPSRFYAFANEILPDTDPPEFQLNEPLRTRVSEYLAGSAPNRRWQLKVLKYLLLIFVAACVTMVITDELTGKTPTEQTAEAALLEAGRNLGDGYLVCVIRTARSCTACVAMEKYAQQTLNDHYASETAAGRIRFTKIAAVGDANSAFREKQQILATSLILFEIGGGEVQRSRILSDAWQLLQDEEEFIAMMNEQLRTFMGESE